MPFLCTRVSLYFSSLLGCISFLLPPLLFLFFLFTLVIILAQGVLLFLLAYLGILIFLDFICYIPLVYRPSTPTVFTILRSLTQPGPDNHQVKRVSAENIYASPK